MALSLSILLSTIRVRLFDVAKSPNRFGSGSVGRDAPIAQFLLTHVEVKLELVLDLSVDCADASARNAHVAANALYE